MVPRCQNWDQARTGSKVSSGRDPALQRTLSYQLDAATMRGGQAVGTAEPMGVGDGGGGCNASVPGSD